MAADDYRTVDGWLSETEAGLLAHAAKVALDEHAGPLVEVGSYLGRSTIVLARIARAHHASRVVHAIDPHQGRLSVTDPPGESTLQRFLANLKSAGLRQWVSVHRRNSTDVVWRGPIALLYIDGCHDAASCTTDFLHFARFIRGYVAFHDYRPDVPGVTTTVDGLAAAGWTTAGRADSLIVLKKPEET